jgi:CTP synthase (UTP-ammonia lyase)
MSARLIALVGDYSKEKTAHRAIPAALELARAELGADVRWHWIATRHIHNPETGLAGYHGAWLVPGSPYENMAGALAVARWARTGGRPFLGTCGGFQHALIEFARDVAGIPDADHAETNPGGAALLLTQLRCSLVEKSGQVHFAPGSRIGSAYGAPTALGEYRCSYGFNPDYRGQLEAAGLNFTSWDDDGEVRGAELAAHPFFCGVLFQPERAALRGEVPPLARAFVRAVAG